MPSTLNTPGDVLYKYVHGKAQSCAVPNAFRRVYTDRSKVVKSRCNLYIGPRGNKNDH